MTGHRLTSPKHAQINSRLTRYGELQWLVYGWALLVMSCTLQNLDEGLERQTCETRADCADLNQSYPNADPCLEWTCNRATQLCQVRGRDRDDDQVVDIICPGGTDCNDLSADVYPGATEICDGLDNNCNSRVDEGLYQATTPERVSSLQNVTQGSPLSVAHAPDDEDLLYALVEEADASQARIATWRRGETATFETLSVAAEGDLGTTDITAGAVSVVQGRPQVAVAARSNNDAPTCEALLTGPLSGASVRVSEGLFASGLAQSSGATCPSANDGILNPQVSAHNASVVLWQALADRPFPQVRQCGDDLTSAVLLSTPEIDSAMELTSHAVGFNAFSTLDVGKGRALVAIAEDRGGSDTGVFFYVVSGEAASPIITQLGRGLHALQPRYIHLERGNPVGDSDAIEVALTIQVGCFKTATIIVQRYSWQASRTSIKPRGRPYQVSAESLSQKPSLYGASTVWNGADWFVAWNESGQRIRMRRLTPVAEILLASDEQVLFESQDANGGYEAPHTFLDSQGRPLFVARAGQASPGLYETVVACGER